jgi:hypothetical protein
MISIAPVFAQARIGVFHIPAQATLALITLPLVKDPEPVAHDPT